MPNDFSSFMNTVAARFSELTDNLKPHAAFLSASYINPTPEQPLPPNETVKLNLVDVDGSVVNHISNSTSTANVNTTGTSIQLNDMPTKTFRVTSYEAARVADNPALLDESIKVVMTQMLEYINGKLSALFTTTNFNTAGNITGTGTGAAADAVTLADITSMWSTLAARKIPITDVGNCFIVTHPLIYGKWLESTDFTKATSIGDEYASNIRTNGNLFPLFNFLPLFDYQAPVSGTSPNFAYTSAMFHRRATVCQFAFPEKPMDGTMYRYTSFAGIPILLTAQYNENHGSSGGPYNQLTVRTLAGYQVFRKDHCVLHTTPGA